MRLRVDEVLKRGKYKYVVRRCYMSKEEFEKLFKLSNEWEIKTIDEEKGEAMLKAVQPR